MDDGFAYELDLIRGLTDEKVRNTKKSQSGGNPKTNAEINLTIECLLRSVWEHREIAATSSDLYRRRLHDSVPNLPCLRTHGGWDVGKRLKTDQDLRDLWERFYSRSHESENMQSALLQRVGEIERAKKMAWPERIKATGNGLVPQTPEMIGRAIADAMEREP